MGKEIRTRTAQVGADASIALRYRRWWQAVGWMLVAIVVWLSLTPHPPEPPGMLRWDKANHFIAYGALMYWFAQAFVRHWRWPLFLVCLGLALEFVQSFSRVRTLEVADMFANVLGVLFGYGLANTSLGSFLATLDAWLAGQAAD